MTRCSAGGRSSSAEAGTAMHIDFVQGSSQAPDRDGRGRHRLGCARGRRSRDGLRPQVPAKSRIQLGRHDRRRGVSSRPQHDHARGQRQLDGDDRGARTRPRVPADAGLLVPAMAVRQGLHRPRAEPVHRRLHDPSGCEMVRQRPDHRRRLQVHLRHDHESQEQRRQPQRLRQDPRVQRRQPYRVPDGVRGDLRPVP